MDSGPGGWTLSNVPSVLCLGFPIWKVGITSNGCDLIQVRCMDLALVRGQGSLTFAIVLMQTWVWVRNGGPGRKEAAQERGWLRWGGGESEDSTPRGPY